MSRTQLRILFGMLTLAAVLNLVALLIIFWPYVERLESWLNGRP